jgi:hypothetical protein
MYEWILEYLQERIPERELWDFVAEEGFEVLHDFFVSDLPEPYRHRVLDVLSREVPDTYAERMLTTPERRTRSRRLIGQLEILAMMAAEVRRELDEREEAQS